MKISDNRAPTLAELLRSAIQNTLFDVHTALPGKVEKYDTAKQKIDVKPLLKRTIVIENGDEILEDIPVIREVPVLFPRAGGFFMSFPIQPGDHVLLIFNERSIDKFVSGGDNDPDLRMHDISDAVAIPGFYPFSKALSNSDSDKEDLVLGMENGPRIFINKNEINLYEKDATDYVALAQKTDERITALEQAFEEHKTNIYANHTHLSTYLAPLIPASPITVGPMTPLPLPEPHPAGESVAAKKVKAT